MNRFLMLMMIVIGMFSFQTCEDETIVEPPPVVELEGCEAAELYDWANVHIESTLDSEEDMWYAFTLTEATVFSVYLDNTGFKCTIYNGCDGEFGLGEPIYEWETIGNGFEVGLLFEGDYYLNIFNQRQRTDFSFELQLNDIIYGCMDDMAINYNGDANIDDGNCIFNDCNTEYYTSTYGEMMLDCEGNCGPVSWHTDGWCDDGNWGIYNEVGEIVPVVFWCEELQWDGGDCEVIPGECPEGQLEDCNGNCAPETWVGDGGCDDGSWSFNGVPIYFNCEVFNNDGGDCDGQGRIIQQSKDGKVKVGN